MNRRVHSLARILAAAGIILAMAVSGCANDHQPGTGADTGGRGSGGPTGGAGVGPAGTGPATGVDEPTR